MRRDQWVGTGGSGSGSVTSEKFSIIPLCPNRHASSCHLTYSEREISAHQQELRVDVVVDWMPIDVVLIPMTGVVTNTGYTTISPIRRSSGVVKVNLTPTETIKLRGAMSLLREVSVNMCMEDSTLYKISVVSTAGGRVVWSAIADECPGDLTVTSLGNSVVLDARSCALERLVASYFAANTARGTRAGLKVCHPS